MMKKQGQRIISNFSSGKFTQIANAAVQDETLSWKARGILCYLASLPSDWIIFKEEIARHSTDGYAAFNTGWKELIHGGYVYGQQQRFSNGKFDGYTWLVSDIPRFSPNVDFPQSDNPSSIFPIAENPSVDNHQLQINTNTNTYLTNNNDTSNDTSKEISIDYSDLFVNNFNREFITKKTIEKLNLFGDVRFSKELIDIIFQTKYQVENYRENENRKLGISAKEKGLGTFKLDGDAFSILLEEKVNEFILQNKLKNAKDQKINNLKSYFRVVMRTFWENCLLNDDFYGVDIIYEDWEYKDFLYDCKFDSKEARHNFIYGKERTHYNGQSFSDFLKEQKMKVK